MHVPGLVEKFEKFEPIATVKCFAPLSVWVDIFTFLCSIFWVLSPQDQYVLPCCSRWSSLECNILNRKKMRNYKKMRKTFTSVTCPHISWTRKRSKLQLSTNFRTRTLWKIRWNISIIIIMEVFNFSVFKAPTVWQNKLRYLRDNLKRPGL